MGDPPRPSPGHNQYRPNPSLPLNLWGGPPLKPPQTPESVEPFPSPRIWAVHKNFDQNLTKLKNDCIFLVFGMGLGRELAGCQPLIFDILY
jgi:hypothetical protein